MMKVKLSASKTTQYNIITMHVKRSSLENYFLFAM